MFILRNPAAIFIVIYFIFLELGLQGWRVAVTALLSM